VQDEKGKFVVSTLKLHKRLAEAVGLAHPQDLSQYARGKRGESRNQNAGVLISFYL